MADPTVCLVRHGETVWSGQGRIHGRRDVDLSEEGRARAERLGRVFSTLPVVEVIASPLRRAVDTAAAIATPFSIEVARDPRLTDFDAGRWEGEPREKLSEDPAFQHFMLDDHSTAIPGTEPLEQVRDRTLGAVRQAVQDNPGGDAGALVVAVTHAGPIRVLVAHVLGMPLPNYHRLRVSLGSITVLRFDADLGQLRVLAVNITDLSDVLR